MIKLLKKKQTAFDDKSKDELNNGVFAGLVDVTETLVVGTEKSPSTCFDCCCKLGRVDDNKTLLNVGAKKTPLVVVETGGGTIGKRTGGGIDALACTLLDVVETVGGRRVMCDDADEILTGVIGLKKPYVPVAAITLSSTCDGGIDDKTGTTILGGDICPLNKIQLHFKI